MSKLAAAILALATVATPAAADCRFTLNFDFGSARLELADALLLGELARRYAAGPVRLTAHADDDGTEADNIRVARARAQAVIGRLEAAGLHRGAVVQAAVLSDDWDAVPSLGWSAPLNRRVELFVGGCDPRNHPEARRLDSPGVALTQGGRVYLTSPLPPSP